MTTYHRNQSLAAVVLEKDTQVQGILWREFLDTFYLSEQDKRLKLISEEPPLTHTHWDALVAAATAWLCRKADLPKPGWIYGRSRCTYPAWSTAKRTREIRLLRLLAPPEFLARNLFVSQSFMLRARTPLDWIDPEPLWAKMAKERFFSG